jgi:endogenous inhibitor of DNA gyrase (YacG/DUF329 family)
VKRLGVIKHRGRDIMVNALEKKKNGRKPVTYYKSDREKTERPLMVAEEMFEYMASCPVCDKRVFDVSDIPGSHVRVRIKCPHCRRIVKIPLTSEQ